jgi:hypothetical protein
VNLDVVLLNDTRVVVAEGICRNTNPQDCIVENSFGPEDGGVVILESHSFIPRWIPLISPLSASGR